MDEKSLDQKFNNAIIEMRKIHPYFSAVYERLKKKETKSVDTMGVDVNTLYYNADFVSKLTFGEFLYVCVHEEAHLMLKHHIRRGKRDSILYNIAADLYVNRLLDVEFGARPDDCYKNRHKGNQRLKVPEGAVYCSSVSVDLDTVERIYSLFDEQADKNGYNRCKEIGIIGFLQERGISITEFDGFEFEYGSNMTGNSTFRLLDIMGEDSYRVYKFKILPKPPYIGLYGEGSFEVISGGYVLDIFNTKYTGDLLDNGTDQTIQEEELNDLLNAAYTKANSMKSDLSSVHIPGTYPGTFKRLISELQNSQVDWQRLLRNYLIKMTSKELSFSTPDKRLYYQDFIYPGTGHEDALSNIKICIDVSGSISDKTLGHFYTQILDLFNRYQVKGAEVVYWDTTVQSVQLLSNVRTFKAIQTTGGGGTDPASIFNYFDSSLCKNKPSLTIVLTDGYFSFESISSKQRNRYKNTIWLMSRFHFSEFKPPFGVKALANFRDN